MAGNFKKDDLRIQKTYVTLLNTMNTLLKSKNFNKITVNDLCCEALVSRATFYVHFEDKYDLLKYWLNNINIGPIKDIYNHKELEISINQFIQKNKKIVMNILIDANSETLEIINKFVAVNVANIINICGHSKNRNVTTLSNFCTGGIMNILMLHVKKHCPQNDNAVSVFLFDMIMQIMEWVRNEKNGVRDYEYK